MGGKSGKKQKDSNYMVLTDATVSPWIISNYEKATLSPAGSVKALTPKQVLEHIGTPIILLDIFFKGHSGLFLTANATDLPYGKITYKAQADLQGLSNLTSTTEINTDGFDITLSGIDDTFIQIVQSKSAKEAAVKVSAGFLDPDGNLASVFQVHKGSITTSEVSMDYKAGSIKIKFRTTSAYKKLDKISGQRPANATHQAYYAGDKCFEYCGETETEEWKVKS